MSISIQDRKKVILHTFQNGYFGHIILEKTLWSDLEEYIFNYAASIKDENCLQDEMMKLRDSLWEAVNTHELNEYPVAHGHKERVKTWLNTVLNLLDDSMPKKDDDSNESEYIFKTFERSFGEYVTLLEENKSILGHGTTGLTSWQGALMLTDWFVINSHILKNKRILELGSGVGLLGIHLLKTCPDILEYTFTDTNNDVLNFLNYNISLNLTEKGEVNNGVQRHSYDSIMRNGPPTIFSPLNADSAIAYYQRPSDNDGDDNASVCLRKCDWNNGLPKWNLRDFDVILGSDIVYERSLIPPLVKILKSSMEMEPRRRAYIACTERSTTTLELFESEVIKEGLIFEILYKGMYSPRDSILNSDVQHQRTRIYEIQKGGGQRRNSDQTRTL